MPMMSSAAYETNSAVCLLTNQTHLFGIAYMVFAVIAVLILTKKASVQGGTARRIRRYLDFLYPPGECAGIEEA